MTKKMNSAAILTPKRNETQSDYGIPTPAVWELITTQVSPMEAFSSSKVRARQT